MVTFALEICWSFTGKYLLRPILIRVLLAKLETHVIAVSFGKQDIHFAGFTADESNVQRIRTQIHLATVGFVDRDGWHFTQHLFEQQKKIR